MEMTYLTILRKLYEFANLGLADAGASATTALEAAGYSLNYQAADEAAYRLTTATKIIGQDWDRADGETRRMLLHLAELPSGTLQYLVGKLGPAAEAGRAGGSVPITVPPPDSDGAQP